MISCDERAPLCATPSLYLFFPTKRILDARELLFIHEPDGQTRASVYGSLARVVLIDPAFDVAGAPDVVAVIGTFQDVLERHQPMVPPAR